MSRPTARRRTTHERTDAMTAGGAADASPAQPDGPVKVFLVDDHALFRTGVKAELAGLEDERIQVVGEAGSVGEAVVRITATLPDVVLLDVHMPDGGGRAVLEQVHRPHPEVVFLALSVSDAAEDVINVIRAGARGYV